MNSKICNLIGLILVFFSFGCSSRILKYDKAADLKVNSEYSQQVKIEEPTAPAEEEAVKTDDVNKKQETKPEVAAPAPEKKPETKKKSANKPKPEPKKKAAEVVAASKHEPAVEDQEGFEARRPVTDPFRVGERIVHKVFYDASIFDFVAGTLTMKINPFAQVNGRKAYSLDIGIMSSSFFSHYYSVDDRIRAYMDYEDMVPTTFTLHVKETKQLREGQMYFDFGKNLATYWEKKYTEKNGQENKKQEWEILPFSQNVFSAVYYMRTFQWKDGKEYAFRVADDNENVVFKGKVVGRETLKTDAGTFKAIKIKPEFTVKGVFKPVGDIYIWISDDDRKYILRIESKIKIGTLVSEITELDPGTP